MTNRNIVGGVLAVSVAVVVALVLLLGLMRPPITGVPQQPPPSAPTEQPPVSTRGTKAPANGNWRLENFGHPHRIQKTRISYVGRGVRIHNPWYYQRQPVSNVYPIANGSFTGLSPRLCAETFSNVPVSELCQYQRDLGDQRSIVQSEQTLPSYASRLPVSIMSSARSVAEHCRPRCNVQLRIL